MMMKLLVLLASLVVVNSLDVEVGYVTCDPDLPVSANITLDCNGSSRCSFGEEAQVNGTVYYNGLVNTEVQNNIGYATANISMVSLNFNLFENKEISLCSYTMEANSYGGYNGYGGYQYNCPNDGAYNYSVLYTLPSAGKETQSWFGSGWKPTGVIQLFADEYDTVLIGECTLGLTTYVTQKSGQEYETPPASLVSAIVLGSLLGITLLWFCCCCCTKTKQEPSARQSFRPYRVQGEDSVMNFRRMTEADRMA